MPKYPVKLGKAMSGPLGVSMPGAEPSSDEMFYPSVQLEWEDDYDLPESGEITFRFKKASETNDKRGQTVSLDLTEILATEADEAEDEESTGDRLDKEYKKAKKKSKKKVVKDDAGTFELDDAAGFADGEEVATY